MIYRIPIYTYQDKWVSLIAYQKFSVDKSESIFVLWFAGVKEFEMFINPPRRLGSKKLS